MEDIVVFMTRKVFNSDIKSIASFKQVIFAEKLQIKITSLWKQKHKYLIHTRPDKAVEGTVVNRTFKFLY